MAKSDLTVEGMFKWLFGFLAILFMTNVGILSWFLVTSLIFMVSYNCIIPKVAFLAGHIPFSLSYLESLSMLFVIGIPMGILRSCIYKREAKSDS